MAHQKKKTIEQNLKSLDLIVKEFEEGKVDLENSIQKYKKANELIEKIKKELEDIQLKIKEVKS